MVFDGNNSSTRERRGHNHLRDLAIESINRASREALTEEPKRGRLATVLTVDREVAIFSADQAEGLTEAAGLEMPGLVACKASEVMVSWLGKWRGRTSRQRRGRGQDPTAQGSRR